MKMSKCLILYVFTLSLSVPFLSLGTEVRSTNSVIYLNELESEMLNQSLDIKAKEFDVAAAAEKREALSSNYIPKLTLEGNYKYLSEIPEINMAPGRSLKFGDNMNYSIGPTLSMTLFDFNSKAYLQTAFDKSLSSKENEAKDLRANNLFKTRFHYLNLVFLLEKRNLISDSLKVANKQLNDVSAKKRYGSGSKLDLLTAQKEVHELESQYKEVIFNIVSEQTELFKVTYLQKIKDAKLENDSHQLEKLTELQNRFFKYREYTIDAQDNSKVKSIKAQSEALESQARSISKQRYPKINLFVRSSLDYPNGPELSEFNQNLFGVSLSMPLFDGGEISHNTNEKSFQAMALRHQALNEERNISESIQLMLKRIENLADQNETIRKKIDECNQIANLVYKSYQDGSVTFIEVERANIKNREAKLSLSSNQYQIILNLIQLARVAGE